MERGPSVVAWVCFDMAAQGQGLIVVALYPSDSVADHAYILGHSGARLALVHSGAQWDLLQGESAQFPMLARVWIRDAGPEFGAQSTGAVTRRLADALIDASEIVPAYEVAPSALATLIYTSGTTGRPKGVMLSHAALLWNAAAVAVVIPPRRDDVFLSVLPLAHAFERTVGCYLPMIGGATVACARSPQDLAEEMKVLGPTALLGVPRLFERIYAAIRRRGEANWISNTLLRLFAWLGCRQAPEPQPAQHRADAALGQGHMELGLDHAGQIHSSPAHHAVDGKVRSFANHLRHKSFLFGREARLRPGRDAVAEPAMPSAL